MGLVCESLLDVQWSCLEELPVNNGTEVAERDSEAGVLLQAQPCCPGGFHLPLGRANLKEENSSRDSTGEGVKARAGEICQPEDSWQNGLLTIFVSVQKETNQQSCDGP